MDSWDLLSTDTEPHKPTVLRSDDGAARAIAINLPAGEQLGDHEVHEHAYLVLVQGALEIKAEGGESQTGGPGFVAHWTPHERHEVRATEDSRFLLLLAPWPGAGHPSQR
jgi:quercetin dioxygenase-like cupin family protein